MVGVLYILITALLMIGAILDHGGWAVAGIVVVVVLFLCWVLLPGGRQRR
jgi:hypothetical protein